MSARTPRIDTEERLAITQQTKTGRTTTGFDQFDLHSKLLSAVADAGFDSPRPIQVKTIPAALEGRDVLGLAQTGTGKTAAFALPILERLRTSQTKGVKALVVAPTRELAAQVQAEFERLARHTHLRSTAIFGGVPIPRQIRELRQAPDIVVACPGRLLDLVNRGALTLKGVEVLVLDEADHMFDMGFLPDVRRILRALPARRQNLLFSATMPREIRRLADEVLQRPKVVELAHSKPAETIEHALLHLAEGDKFITLARLLSEESCRSAIVFLRTKRRAKKLAERLAKRGHGAVALQGNMSQGQRERALNGFRENRHEILVATDIAARGLDIAGVSLVVNFDLPNTPDAYTHRIGRTGRSEQSGEAVTFVTPDDASALRAIEKHLGQSIARKKPLRPGLIEEADDAEPIDARRKRPQRGRGGRGAKQPARQSAQPARSKRTRSGTGPRPDAGSRPAAVSRPAKASKPKAAQAPKVPQAAFGQGVLDTPRTESRGEQSGSSRPRRRRRGA